MSDVDHLDGLAYLSWQFSPYGFRAVSFGGVSKLLSITKMLKFNSATKHVFTYYETRKAYSWHSHQIETAIHSELQLAVAFVFDVPDADLQFYDQTSAYGDETRKHISPLCLSNCN